MHHYRALLVGIGTGGTVLTRRNSWQTLLVGVVYGGVMGLLPGHVERDPGKRSPRLGIPGLKYAAPLGLKRMELKKTGLERTDGGSPVVRGRLGGV
jgi:hypothetical protein